MTEDRMRTISPTEVLFFTATSAYLALYWYMHGNMPVHSGVLSWLTRAIDPLLLPLTLYFMRRVYWTNNQAGWVIPFLICNIIFSMTYGSAYGLMLCVGLAITTRAIHSSN